MPQLHSITELRLGNPFNTHETIVLATVHHHGKVRDTPEALAGATHWGGSPLTPDEAKAARDVLCRQGWLSRTAYADGTYLKDRNPAWFD